MDSAVRLADLGAASVGAVWVPVLAWSALALAVDAALRAGRASAPVGLWTRGALVAALPALLVLPPVLSRWVPSLRAASSVAGAAAPPAPAAALARAGWAPTGTAEFGAAPPPLLGVALFDVALGVAVLAAALSGVVALGVVAGGAGWLGRVRRRLRPAPDTVQAEADRLAARFGLRRAPAVVVAEPGSAPFTVGWIRPVVAVPPDLGGEPLRLALAHEIAHVRASHFGWAVAERAVRAAFVWHPLVHVLGRALALDRERAADAAVLGLWPDRARPYGRLLLTCASRPTPRLALGASSSALVHRLTAMTHPRPARRHVARAAGLALFAVPVVLAASAVPDPPRPAASGAPGDTLDRDRTAAPFDSLDAYVTQRIGSYGDRGNRVEICLDPGTPRAVAERVAAHYADGDRPGTLVVTFDGEHVTRSTLRKGGLPPPPTWPPAWFGAGWTAETPFLDVIEDHQAGYTAQNAHVEIRLKAGESRETAEQVAGYFADGERAGQLVVVFDDGRIERSTLRDDGLPAPTPGRC